MKIQAKITEIKLNLNYKKIAVSYCLFTKAYFHFFSQLVKQILNTNVKGVEIFSSIFSKNKK